MKNLVKCIALPMCVSACGSDTVDTPNSVRNDSGTDFDSGVETGTEDVTADSEDSGSPAVLDVVGDPFEPIDPQVESCREMADPSVVCRPKNVLSVFMITSYREQSERRYISVSGTNWAAAPRERLLGLETETRNLAGCVVRETPAPNDSEPIEWLDPLDAGSILVSTSRGVFSWLLDEGVSGRVDYRTIQDPDFDPSDIVTIEVEGGPDLSQFRTEFAFDEVSPMRLSIENGRVIARWERTPYNAVVSMTWFDDTTFGTVRCEIPGDAQQFVVPSEVIDLAETGSVWSLGGHLVSNVRLLEFEETRIHTVAATFTDLIELQFKQ